MLMCVLFTVGILEWCREKKRTICCSRKKKPVSFWFEIALRFAATSSSASSTRNLYSLPLDIAVAYRAVFVIVSESEARKRF